MGDRVTAVVRCRDNGRTIRTSLSSLDAQTRRPGAVVVLDCGSVDLYTREELGRLGREGLSTILEARSGHPGTEALGLAPDDYVLLLSADTVLEPGFCCNAAALLDSAPGLSFVFGMAHLLPGLPAAPVLLADLLATGQMPAAAMLRPDLYGQLSERSPEPGSLLEFWIGALSCGRAGVQIGASTAVRSCVPEGLQALQGVYQKHAHLLDRIGPEVLRRKEAYAATLREHRDRVVERRTTLQDELEHVGADIEGTTGDLQALRVPLVDWGDLRRTSPFSPFWGGERGKPLNRYYIEQFLNDHRRDIRGRVLEVKDPTYTNRFGIGVTEAAVLDVDARNPHATIVADLTAAVTIPSDTFDCFILTQVLNVIEDIDAALQHVIRVLRPGGILLCTAAAVDRVSYEGRASDGDFWRFTEASMRARLAGVCPIERVEVRSYGNVMACAAHLYGLAVHEMDSAELDFHDPAFPLIIAARAAKPGESLNRP